MTEWTLTEREFSDGSPPSSLLRQAADWLDSIPGQPRGGPGFYLVGVNWSQHEWTGHGGSDDVLTLFLRRSPEVTSGDAGALE